MRLKKFVNYELAQLQNCRFRNQVLISLIIFANHNWKKRPARSTRKDAIMGSINSTQQANTADETDSDADNYGVIDSERMEGVHEVREIMEETDDNDNEDDVEIADPTAPDDDTKTLKHQTNCSAIEKASEKQDEENLDETFFWNYADLELMKCSNDAMPSKLATSNRLEFSSQNILKGCKWAPDGSCLMTNSDDNKLRIFNLPDSLWNMTDSATPDNISELPYLEAALKIAESGPIYDYSWYPFMSSTDPATCCFVSSAAENPVHLFDAFDGKLRATYLPVNHLEQIVAPHAVEFDLTGNNIYCGFRDSIKIFNLHRPGPECIERKLKTNTLPDLNQVGIISCFAFNPACSTIYACGSFQKTVGLYLEDGTVMAILTGHLGGLTHLKFSQDGTKLISGGRKDSRLIVWDMRNLGEEYQILERDVGTSQRIYFDITSNGRYLVSGQTNGQVSVWDLLTSTESKDAPFPQAEFRASSDCVNGVSINPRMPVLATTSGQRHFCDIADDSDGEELFVKSKFAQEHAVSLWKFT